MKANSNLAIVNLLARLGSGFDIVSGGELARAMAAGADPARIVFSGVGKTEAEMARALQLGILCFNLESASELEHLNRVAGSLGQACADQLPGQSGRRSEDPPVHLDRPEGRQVRHRIRRRAAAVPTRSGPAAPRRARHRHAHRLADHRPRTALRGGRQGVRSGRSPERGRYRARAHRPGWRHRHPLPRRGDDRAGRLRGGHPRSIWESASSSCCSSRAACWSAMPARC